MRTLCTERGRDTVIRVAVTLGVIAGVFLPLPLTAQSAANPRPGVSEPVPVEEAGNLEGQRTEVTGQVVQVSRIGSGLVFLNFGRPHPDAVFTVVVRPGLAGGQDWAKFEGQEVTVRGTVQMHKGRPQIELAAEDDLRPAGSGDSDASSRPAEASAGGNPASDDAALSVLGSPLVDEDGTPDDPGAGGAASLELPTARSGGEMETLSVDLTPAERKLAGRSPAGVAPEKATVGLMVPAGFVPTGNPRVLVVFATDDGGGAHVGALPRFGRLATARGWVALAANGPVLEKSLSPQWHAAMLGAGLRALAQRYPESGKWDFFLAGNSGGAARASMMAAAMLAEGYTVRGVFMGGAGAERFSAGQAIFRPPRAAISRLAVFLSHGDADRLISPAMAAATAQAVRNAGVRNIRRDAYAGGHGMNEESLRLALEWWETGAR